MTVPVATISMLVGNQETKLDEKLELIGLEVHRELNKIPEAKLTLLDGSVAKRTFAASNLAFFAPGATIRVALRFEGKSADKVEPSPPLSTAWRGLDQIGRAHV